MNVTYLCTQCHTAVRHDVPGGGGTLDCPACGAALSVDDDAVEHGKLGRCLVCPSRELYVRKDFSQRLGVTVVAVGIAISCITWAYYRPLATFAVLLGTALLDLVLYWLVGNVLQCYRCQAIYRGVAGLEAHEPFNLEIHEKYRQLAARQPAAADGASAAGRAPDQTHASGPKSSDIDAS